MKLLIVGAGYVGKELLNYLKELNHEIYATTTEQVKVATLQSYAKEVILLKAPSDLSETISKCDGLILLIAPKKDKSYTETYLDTAKQISLALEKREKPFYILYTSSSSVYEGINQEFATEDLALSPNSEKARVLLETEELLLNSQAETCILRLGGIFGPNREIRQRALSLEGKTLPGSGEEPTNHIHLHDIVKAICFCLENRLKGIYNLVNDEHPKRKELYRCHFTTKDTTKSYKVSNRKIKAAGFNSPMKCIEK